MAGQGLRVVAHIRAKVGTEERLKQVLLSLTAPTRQEAGCHEYQLYQNNDDRQDLVFVEEWESDAALDAHLQTAHIKKALEVLPELTEAPPDIRRYSLVG